MLPCKSEGRGEHYTTFSLQANTIFYIESGSCRTQKRFGCQDLGAFVLAVLGTPGIVQQVERAASKW